MPATPPYPYTIREATHADRSAMEALLRQGDLSTGGLLAPGSRYWVTTEPDDTLAGVIGLELGQSSTVVLVRSLAVRPDRRGAGLGAILVRHALAWAAGVGVQRAYLFSDVREFWQAQGFHPVPTEELLAALPHTPEVIHFRATSGLAGLHAWRRDLVPRGASA